MSAISMPPITRAILDGSLDALVAQTLQEEGNGKVISYKEACARLAQGQKIYRCPLPASRLKANAARVRE